MSFRKIAGHRPLLSLLARAVARDTLPPALLFVGPEGVGKRHTAMALAQAVNCLEPVTAADRPTTGRRSRASVASGVDACGGCTSCQRIERGLHADVVMIVPGDSGTIKIDQVRDAVERAGYRPFEGRRRVVDHR